MKKYFLLVTLITIGFVCHAQSGGSIDNVPANSKTHEVAKVKIFPNPASNVVNVLGLKNSSSAQILVLDIYGNTMLNHKWTIRRNAVNIPISNLETGAYILLINSEEQRVRTKFYKQ